MEKTIEDRKAALLDQLEKPATSQQEIQRIKTKLEILDKQE